LKGVNPLGFAYPSLNAGRGGFPEFGEGGGGKPEVSATPLTLFLDVDADRPWRLWLDCPSTTKEREAVRNSLTVRDAHEPPPIGHLLTPTVSAAICLLTFVSIPIFAMLLLVEEVQLAV
jgi:hypothetical protein